MPQAKQLTEQGHSLIHQQTGCLKTLSSPQLPLNLTPNTRSARTRLHTPEHRN